MAPFCLGIVAGCVLVAAVVVIGSHVVMEIADGRLADW
jgi:hypothetical protein